MVIIDIQYMYMYVQNMYVADVAATCKCSLSLTVGEHGAVRLDAIVVRDLHVARVVALVLNSKSFDAQPAQKQETHGWVGIIDCCDDVTAGHVH